MRVENDSQLMSTAVDDLPRTIGLDGIGLRRDDLSRDFEQRREFLINLIDAAMGTPVQRESCEADVVGAAAGSISGRRRCRKAWRTFERCTV